MSGDHWTWPDGSVEAPRSGVLEGDARPRDREQRYDLAGELGRGGMGRVHSAQDTRLGRDVALKVLRPGADPRRMQREARITAILEHPGVVPVYDAGVTEDGQPFYTMRLIRGRSLAEVLAETPEQSERLKLLRRMLDVCQTVAFAHSRGVLHRDLKPANIMIGDFGETQVVDWGLARVEGDSGDEADITGERARLTGEGTILGTPAYMSPEQARGEAVGAGSDVWSLGVIVYELVQGTTPFAAPSSAEVLARLMAGTPSIFEEPPELAAIVRRALQPELDRRYPSAQELAQDLADYLDGRRVAAYRYSNWELLQRALQPFRVPLGVGLLALLVVSGVAAAGFQQTSTERDRALRAEADLTDALSLADRSLQDVLVAQAQVALDVGARAEAEILAAEALSLGEHAGARGVLAAFAQRERPRVLSRTPIDLEGCAAIDASDSGELLVCGTERLLSLQRLSPEPVELWSRPMRVDELAMDEEHDVLWTFDAEQSRVWRLRLSTGKPLAEPVLVKHASWVLRPGLDGDSVQLDSSTNRGRRVHADGGIEIMEDCSGPLEIVARSWLPDGRALMACTTGLSLGGRFIPMREVFALGASPDGQLIAVCGRDQVVMLDGEGEQVELIDLPEVGMVRGMRWSPDGDMLVVVTERGGVRLIWPGRPGTERIPTTRFPLLRFADNRTLVSIDEERVVWSLPEPAPRVLSSQHGVTSVSFHPDGSVLASTHGNGDVRFHDLSDGRLLAVRQWQQRVVKWGTFTRDGLSYWATAVGDISIRSFETESWEMSLHAATTCRRIAELYDGSLLCTGYSPSLMRVTDGQRVVEVSSAFWDLGGNAQGHALAIGEIGAVLVDPEGLHQLSDKEWYMGDVGPEGEVWVVANLDHLEVHGALEHILELPGQYLVDLAISPDGRWLAAGNIDGILMVWRLEDMELVLKAQGHAGQVAAVEFSADSKLMATGSWDGDVRIWSLDGVDAPAEELGREIHAAWGLELDEVLERRPR